MFIRRRVIKGREYYSVVESYRDEEGRPRQRSLAYLGIHSTIAGALDELDRLDRAGEPGKTARERKRRLLRRLAREMGK